VDKLEGLARIGDSVAACQTRSIELTREEYRVQHAALEAVLDVLDRFPHTDGAGTVRVQVEAALQGLLRKIWPFLDEVDDSE
jgi:hypothetical protein